jgi:hypothetical protein
MRLLQGLYRLVDTSYAGEDGKGAVDGVNIFGSNVTEKEQSDDPAKRSN